MALVDVGKDMNTKDYIISKYKISLKSASPIEIPDVGRNMLAEWLCELNFKTGVEVGVAAGIYSQVLCEANPQMKIFGIDPWQAYKGYQDYVKEDTFKNLEKSAIKRLSKYPNYTILKDFSSHAIHQFADNSLDFVYIDANHKDPYITQDLTEWYKKVVPGGILAGHDYNRLKNNVCDVVDATNAHARKNNIHPWFVLGSKEVVPGKIRDKHRSWMIIKPTIDRTLEHIIEKYNIDTSQPSPIKISCNRYTDLPQLFKELGFVRGAEIGVLEGKYSEVLCRSNPKLKLYSVDAWSFYPTYKNFRKQKDYDRAYEIALKKARQIPKQQNNQKMESGSRRAFCRRISRFCLYRC